jgi:CheY-like chemotaxis protein
MVVEDEKNLRTLYRRDLEKEGHTVITASSAEECLKLLETESPDLVVLDIRMPGMNGIEAMGRILERVPDLPVVLNSAYLSYRDNFLSWTADAYVLKSSDTGELRSTIGQLLETRDRPNHQATA